MFTAPPDQSLEWSDDGVEGAHRFLKRLWALGTRLAQVQQGVRADAADCSDTRREVHSALQKALFDYERQQYNTVVSACMTIVNALNKLDDSPAALAMLREGMGIVLRLLSPIAPHVSHAMWRTLGFGDDIHHAGWPAVDESALRSDTIEYVVQVNGKMRGRIEVAADAPRSLV